MNWKLVSGGQLANPRTTLPSIRDSVIDAGMVLTSVYVKELAASNVVYNLLGFGSDPLAIAGATLETIMLNCPQCLEEYKKLNAVLVAGYGVTPYRLLCAKPVSGPDDIKGEKIKIAGGAEARIIKAIGARRSICRPRTASRPCSAARSPACTAPIRGCASTAST